MFSSRSELYVLNQTADGSKPLIRYSLESILPEA
jgi:hypothetical protein